MVGCFPLHDQLMTSKPVTRIYFPELVQVGTAMPVVTDVDAACGTFQGVSVVEDAPNRTIWVRVIFEGPPPNTACIGAIILRRYQATVTPTKTGTYIVYFKGFHGAMQRTIQVTSDPVPAWSAPEFSDSPNTNY